ncbi:MAG: SELO family protein, partial [Sulfurimonas sp.]
EKEILTQNKREEKMLKVNAKYILKNHILQEAIELAKREDFSMVNDLLKVALNPFDEHEGMEYLTKPTPLKSKNIKLSCSS